MITDIVFDLGKVLVPFDWNIALQRLRPHLTPHMANLLDNDKNAFMGLFHEPSIELETGRIDFDGYQNIVMDILGIRLAEPEFRRIWCDIFWADMEMIDLGHKLSKYYRTWLASNTSQVHYEWIVAKFPQVVFYRGAALSFELGVMKPSREYYEKALKTFGIEPCSTVFIDDLEENVEAAVEFGMEGIVFRNKVDLIPRLEQLKVKVTDLQQSDL